jgi:signal transduction histidine kinase
LVLGRSEAGMLEFNPRRQDLAHLCRRICDEARNTQAAHTHTVTLRLSPEVIDGWFDDGLLQHALGNLLSNAIKYSPQGGEVSVEVTAQGATVLIAVQDSGIGIPEAEIPHLFTSFHRASNVGEIKGTGLGLAIVKNAVELHAGTLSVRSELSRGTCFSVRLPWQTSARP